jgi:maltooligosyltrehalose trehalohydrolase
VRFIDACHQQGLGVLIDAVFNHLGPSGNYLPRFGPYLSSGSNPWGESINIADADADEVRRYIIDCALRWMRDFHADGLRLDAVHALGPTSPRFTSSRSSRPRQTRWQTNWADHFR